MQTALGPGNTMEHDQGQQCDDNSLFPTPVQKNNRIFYKTLSFPDILKAQPETNNKKIPVAA